jgi:hypothetical protein
MRDSAYSYPLSVAYRAAERLHRVIRVPGSPPRRVVGRGPVLGRICVTMRRHATPSAHAAKPVVLLGTWPSRPLSTIFRAAHWSTTLRDGQNRCDIASLSRRWEVATLGSLSRIRLAVNHTDRTPSLRGRWAPDATRRCAIARRAGRSQWPKGRGCKCAPRRSPRARIVPAICFARRCAGGNR